MRTILGQLRLGRDSILAALEPDPNPDDRAHSSIRYAELADAVAKGDELAVEAIEDGAKYLAAGLVSVVNFYNPPLIVLGGGMMKEVDRLYESVTARVSREALSVPGRRVEFARASLGADSGIAGAAALGAEQAPVSA
jgi:glucokinase